MWHKNFLQTVRVINLSLHLDLVMRPTYPDPLKEYKYIVNKSIYFNSEIKYNINTSSKTWSKKYAETPM